MLAEHRARPLARSLSFCDYILLYCETDSKPLSGDSDGCYR